MFISSSFRVRFSTILGNIPQVKILLFPLTRKVFLLMNTDRFQNGEFFLFLAIIIHLTHSINLTLTYCRLLSIFLNDFYSSLLLTYLLLNVKYFPKKIISISQYLTQRNPPTFEPHLQVSFPVEVRCRDGTLALGILGSQQEEICGDLLSVCHLDDISYSYVPPSHLLWERGTLECFVLNIASTASLCRYIGDAYFDNISIYDSVWLCGSEAVAFCW